MHKQPVSQSRRAHDAQTPVNCLSFYTFCPAPPSYHLARRCGSFYLAPEVDTSACTRLACLELCTLKCSSGFVLRGNVTNGVCQNPTGLVGEYAAVAPRCVLGT